MKEHYYNRKEQINSRISTKIRWYDEMIQLCDEAITIQGLVEYSADFQEQPLEERFPNLEIRKVAEEVVGDNDVTISDEYIESVEDRAKDDLIEPVNQKVIEGTSDLIVNIRKHVAKHPREESIRPEPISELFKDLVGIEVGLQANAGVDIEERNVKETAEEIMDYCEERIIALEKKKFPQRYLNQIRRT